VLEVTGDLVVTNQDTLRGEVESLLDDGVQEIVLAVDAMTHIDTSGFSLLV
jgi:anti-anti-sigma regulatory factor